jgi:hypothetical protein
MGLREQIDADIRDALKAGAKDKVSALRMLSAALKNKQIDKRRPLTDDEVVETVRSLIKQRKDSIEQFAKGGRQDLVAKETAEIAILESYLPPAADPAAVQRAVADAIAETGAASPKDLGKVMKAAMAKLAGQNVDGKTVNELARKQLGG